MVDQKDSITWLYDEATVLLSKWINTPDALATFKKYTHNFNILLIHAIVIHYNIGVDFFPMIIKDLESFLCKLTIATTKIGKLYNIPTFLFFLSRL